MGLASRIYLFPDGIELNDLDRLGDGAEVGIRIGGFQVDIVSAGLAVSVLGVSLGGSATVVKVPKPGIADDRVIRVVVAGRLVRELDGRIRNQLLLAGNGSGKREVRLGIGVYGRSPI